MIEIAVRSGLVGQITDSVSLVLYVIPFDWPEIGVQTYWWDPALPIQPLRYWIMPDD